jgi:transglutaminase-like putative cysteine protease
MVIKINSEQGKEELKQFTIPYHAGRQRLDIQKARIIKPTGAVINASLSRSDYLSDPNARLYYDLRAGIIFFADLEPGDFIELAYKISDEGKKNIYGDYFGTARHFGGEHPRLKAEYILLMPENRKIYYKMYNSDVLPLEEKTDDYRIYRWGFEDVRSYEVEPDMPGPSEIYPTLLISTYATWEALAFWYHNLVQDQLNLTDDLRTEVAALISDCEDDRAKVLRIYDYIISNIHYVGLEFGIHSYKPYRVEAIYNRKYGDCKDKASLMAAFLREAGIEANLVLVRTRNLGKIASDIPTLSLFNHVICYVPDFDLLLDGTAEFNAADELPAMDQGTLIAILDDEGRIRLQTSPAPPASANREEKTIEVVVDADGDARMTIESSLRGNTCPPMRRYFQNSARWQTSFEKLLRQTYQSATVNEVIFSDLDPSVPAISYRADCHIEKLAKKADDTYQLSESLASLGLVGRLASLSMRTHDLVIGHPYRSQISMTYHLPPGSEILKFPEPLSLKMAFGSFDYLAEQTGEHTLSITQVLAIEAMRVDASEYERFRDFCLKADQKSSETIRYRIR